ncbi:phosphoribosylformylglycinamidine cyclo-ligase [Blattabacterium cuenoti]|uniref:phosphoribosylformylglycinamidine cyclo-ligase n=1 Tax=Blattabacterium cuenoti TaxID=1653831 RepID=UPI00163CC290|nr:phosphoribosylformylglycinamidine cyclo-ligase [Blattabacterium cuenoti]
MKKYDKFIDKIGKILKNTYNKKVLSNIKNFSGFYKINHEYKNPVIVSGTDGVGTKICLALEYKKYSVIGKDCFAMCINDILCHGATSLFFLDYLACNKIDSYIMEKIINGIANSCKLTNTCFIGGETAEMQDIYPNNIYDIAGFCVGIVDECDIIDGKKLIQENDVIIGIPSSGIHSNGFSLIRKIFSKDDFEKCFFNSKKPLYELLLFPTKIYYNFIHVLLKKFSIHGIANITGGGILCNLSRIIPNGLTAIVKKNDIFVPSIFSFIQEKGKISDKLMWETFNMGIGLIIIVSSLDKDLILKEIISIGEKPIIIGNIVKTYNNKKVFLK